MSNIFKSKEYSEIKKQREQYYIQQNLTRTEQIQFKNYTLEISYYKIKDNNFHTLNYTRGIIKKNNKVIADIKRNCDDFPYLFIKHDNGNEYLFCAEYSEGYTIVNLTNETIKTYISDIRSLGRGICLQKVIEYTKNNNRLTTANSSHESSNELVIYDFSDPDSIPLSIALRCENFSYF